MDDDGSPHPPSSDTSSDPPSDTSIYESDPEEDPEMLKSNFVQAVAPASELVPAIAETSRVARATPTASVGSKTSLEESVPAIPYHVYADLARDRDMLVGQNLELQILVDRMTEESSHRVAVTEAVWKDKIRTVEDIARRRLAEGRSTSSALEETRRVTSLVSWMLSELRAIRDRQN